jgi:uncharacterized protein YegP (UPF0339 family)
MGKSVAGAVWLNEDMLGAYDFWQYWRNAEDADVARFLRLFTTLPMADVARLAALQGAEINEAKKVLATEVTALLHGREKADAAARTAQETFERREVAVGLPTHYVAGADLEGGVGILSLAVQVGFAKSNSEARKAISNSALSVDEHKISDPAYKLTLTDFPKTGVVKFSFGRKRHVLIKPASPVGSMYFCVWNRGKSLWRWTLVTTKHEKIAQSPKGYANKDDCVKSIEAARTMDNSVRDKSSDGKWYGSLVGRDGKTVAMTTKGYSDRGACLNAMGLVKMTEFRIRETTT